MTYQSDESKSQIDYILVNWQNIKFVRDVKVIPNEECIIQQKLLVCDARIVKSEDVRNLYQNGIYGSCNKLIFAISFLKLLWVKWLTLCYREDVWVDKERHMEKTNLVME